MVKTIVGFVAIIKLQPSAYVESWDLGEQCSKWLIPVWGVTEWVFLPAGWFQHSTELFKDWCLHFLLSVMPYMYSKAA